MIYIKKNETNKIVLTLNESSRLISPLYLFEFKNEFNINSTPIYWNSPDMSTSPNRYNLFTLIESTTGSTTGGSNISLSLISGQYEYKVYESSISTLSIEETTGRVIEQGRMMVNSDIITTTKSIYR